MGRWKAQLRRYAKGRADAALMRVAEDALQKMLALDLADKQETIDTIGQILSWNSPRDKIMDHLQRLSLACGRAAQYDLNTYEGLQAVRRIFIECGFSDGEDKAESENARSVSMPAQQLQPQQLEPLSSAQLLAEVSAASDKLYQEAVVNRPVNSLNEIYAAAQKIYREATERSVDGNVGTVRTVTAHVDENIRPVERNRNSVRSRGRN